MKINEEEISSCVHLNGPVVAVSFFVVCPSVGLSVDCNF